MKKGIAVIAVLAMIMTLFTVPIFAEGGTDCFPLYAGQENEVGTVCIENDGDNLYVTYSLNQDAIDYGWGITETHVHVGATLADFPLNKSGNPQVGNFDYNGTHDYVTTYTYEIPLGDFEISNQVMIAAHAVISDAPKGQMTGVLYGTRTTGGTKGLYEIDVVNGTVKLLKALPGLADDVANGTGYSNALAYDPALNTLYFTAPRAVNVSPSPLYSYNIDTEALTHLQDLTGSVVGAEFYNGEYLYIAEKTNNLMSIDLPAGLPVLFKSEFGGAPADFTFGDFAISDAGMLYGSTRVAPQMFFTLDLINNVYSEPLGADALDLQLAFGSNGVLYGTNHATGKFYTVDCETGGKTPLPLTAVGFADLAAGTLFVPTTESAWAASDYNLKRFVEQGNWATYFTYEINSGERLLETVYVQSENGDGVTTVNELESGKSYELRASGTFDYSSDVYDEADAEWFEKAGGWIKGETGIYSDKTNVIDVSVNGDPVNDDWGSYNPEHTYTLPYTGTGDTLHLFIYDTNYTDNAGSIRVDIYEVW